MADRIIIELNCRHPKEIARCMIRSREPADPPYRREIPIYTPSDRIGSDCVKVDPAAIVGVVKTDEPNEGGKFSPLDDVTNGYRPECCQLPSWRRNQSRPPAE
ncbi:MAG: hypothetical protein ACLRS8_05235 [Parabacteroides merdae]